MSEQEKAELKEMDSIIHALRKGEPVPHRGPEWQLAQQLIERAAQIHPRPGFARSLRVRLLRESSINKKITKQATENIYESWLRRITMKRLTFALAGVALVAAIAFAAIKLLPERQESPETAVAAVSTPEVPQVTASPTPQPTAPQEVAAITPDAQPPTDASVSGVSGTEATAEEVKIEPSVPSQSGPFSIGGRGGGGGGGVFGGGGGPFTDAQLTLDATLPDVSESPVFDLPGDGLFNIDLDQLRAFADKMGVSGDLYFEWYPGLAEDGSKDENGSGPGAYRMFDGGRQILAYGDGSMVYNDTSLMDQYGLAPLPFEERAAIAERFASEHGLLDFDYEVHATWGHEVQFLPTAEGRAVDNWSQITVAVAPSRGVISLNYRPLPSFQPGDVESLRSAQEAWDYLQSQFQTGQLYYNLIPSDPAYYAPADVAGRKVNWQREFIPGQSVDMNSWVQVFRPADGSITPRLLTDRNLLISANPEELEAMVAATVVNNNLHLAGTLSGERGNVTLNVESWEANPGPSELYLSGTSRSDSGLVYLELPGGFRIQVANPPQELPIDASINMSTWGVRPTDDGCGAITEWVNIDLNYQEYTEATDLSAHDPYSGITGVTITSVDLVYHNLYPGEAFAYQIAPYRMDDQFHLVPAWRFVGQTSKGDFIEFIVPAPASYQLAQSETQ